MNGRYQARVEILERELWPLLPLPGRSASWTAMCRLSWSGLGNRLPHPAKEQAKGLSPVSTRSAGERQKR
jgi:hypothetical protein